jgi:hypothetical protein
LAGLTSEGVSESAEAQRMGEMRIDVRYHAQEFGALIATPIPGKTEEEQRLR